MVTSAERPLLSVQSLVTHFEQDEGTVRALQGVSFDAYRGKTLGIVGESGCGKSVVARSILRLIDHPGRIVSGQVLLDDEGGGGPVDLVKLDPVGAEMRSIRGGRIGLVFQEPMTALSAFYTVGNQIIETIRKHLKLTPKESREKAIELLSEVGIPRPSRRIDEYPFELSGGLRQRVMIAMALAGDPELLIADEPTTALDVTTQAQILELLRSLQERKNLALIMITHNMGVIAEIAHDVAVMYLGRVVETGTVGTLFESPAHPYTRLLLTSIPSILNPPKTRLATIRGSVPHPYSLPSGCPFHPRCPEKIVGGRCEVDLPLAVARQPEGRVSCFLAEANR